MKNKKWGIILLGLLFTSGSMFFTVHLKKRKRDRNQNLISLSNYKETEAGLVSNTLFRTEDTLKTKKYDSENATTFYNRGNSKSRLQDYKGAIEDFTKSIEHYPKSDAYNNRGIAKAKLNDHKEAVADFTKSIELDPTDPDTYSNRGGSRGALADFRGALADFTKTIELDPKDGSGYFGSGICKLKLGQKNTGCMDLTNAAKLGYPGANEAKMKYCN
jgi:tetratricopeptide (TPR) repeat protein